MRYPPPPPDPYAGLKLTPAFTFSSAMMYGDDEENKQAE